LLQFRPFTDPQTQHLIKDILDGYFPSELQTRYPDGIPFVVSIFIINPNQYWPSFNGLWSCVLISNDLYIGNLKYWAKCETDRGMYGHG
jgi:hypothetical protein